MALTQSLSLSPDIAESSQWEARIPDSGSKKAIRELHGLVDGLRQGDPLKALCEATDIDINELGHLLFDPHSDINEVIFLPLDFTAHAVIHDTATLWRRLTDLPMRELWPGERLKHMADDGLLFAVSSTTSDTGIDWKGWSDKDTVKTVWIGPEPSLSENTPMKQVGRFVLPSTEGLCPPSHLYLTLHSLLATAWSQQEAKKGGIVLNHLRGAAASIETVLNPKAFLNELQDIAGVNKRYRTGFFISPFASCGSTWETQFDFSGCLTLVYHVPGHLSHGPIVTIDGAADDKYVAMEAREELVERYSEADVSQWEALCLDEGNVDDFLSRPPKSPLFRPRTPFFTNNRWYLPVLQPYYDTSHDNLIILDMTGERALPVMLDELS